MKVVKPEGFARRSLDAPDEIRTFERGVIQVVRMDGAAIGRTRLEPGWRWSTSVKPIVGTDSCRAAHLGYVLAGRLKIRLDDGAELEVGPGDCFTIPPGHDAWVVGDTPFQSLELASAGEYARSSQDR